MIEGRPSRTAWRVAVRRAAHQLNDRPLVLEDPIALRIIGETEAARLRADPAAVDGHSWNRSLRAFLAARSRMAEDALAAAVAAGVRQYVVLGAGLDTSAYRSPHTATGLRTFEVDHPATQAWKQERLRKAGIETPSALAFVPVDFERDRLPDRLIAAGFATSAPAFFSWLGVTLYLDAEAVQATLRDVSTLAGDGGGVTFDYSATIRGLSLRRRFLAWRFAARVRRVGEPWRSSFDPVRLDRDLSAMGFTRIEDLGPEALNARYFSNRQDGLRVRGLGRVVTAWRARHVPA